eukprot:CAMPEP_0178955466 /NCGR_PEP_ID=MMETSP0789-20121207/9620_1 /TAXON_ID=3005 /ORGANISM="Rhizosolenia setigera, Strain CCMP 1694" /LENGTH=73 /DNA_ID=CAMNT_0020637099 /DNA_START=155 /DNA_END=377 /DNA_ORIENTATION=-
MELYHNLDDEAPAPRLVRQQWESGSGMSVLEEDGGDEGVWAGLVLAAGARAGVALAGAAVAGAGRHDGYRCGR